MLTKLLKQEAGFTLIELLIVVVIIGILAAVGVPIYSRYITTARASEAPTIMMALVEYSESYSRAHPALISSSNPTWAGSMLFADAESNVADGDWIDEVVGTDNEYFDYFYARSCPSITGITTNGVPCLYAQGKASGAGGFDTSDYLVYFFDADGDGNIAEAGDTWWSGADRLLDVVPD